MALVAPLNSHVTKLSELGLGLKAAYVFVYGALRRHIENGEEAFIISLDRDDRVEVCVASISNTAWRPARLLSPVARLGQKIITARYLRAYQSVAGG